MSERTPLPRENIIRAVMPGVQFRDDPGEGDPRPILFGHFSRFNEWTEINSTWEGRFMERFVPRAFAKTLKEQIDRMRVLFQHGHDPEVGDKPIAEIISVREDEEGAYYEARLFDGLPPLVTDGLRANQYGASMRFSVMREEIDEEPGRSEHNPDGLPERTVKEARVAEFGPVTFPAYKGATAGVRSLTDEFLLSCIRQNPEGAREMFDRAISLQDIAPTPTDKQEGQEQEQEQDAPSKDDAAATEPHLSDERRETPATPPGRRTIYGMSRKETSKPWLLGPSKSTKRS